MKHRQVGIDRVRLVNSDGHAIGLDIGATSVRAAILAPGTLHGRPSVTVHGLGGMPLPSGTVLNGVVCDQMAVTRAIKQLWQDYKFNCRNVILGVTNQQVVVREVNFPNIPPAQRAQALPFQARDIIALPLDQAILDFIPLGEAGEEDETVPGLLVAAPRDPVSAAVKAVERAGLKVARVDLAGLAMLRSIGTGGTGGTGGSNTEALVDIGAHLTTVVIHRGGVPRVIRTVARGGKDLTEQLASRTGMDVEQAEAAKREFGLTGENAMVTGTLSDIVRPLVAEIRSSLRLLGPGNGSAPVARVCLTGGGAALPGLVDAVSEQLGVPTGLGTPMQHVSNRWATKRSKYTADEESATAVSVGLAMGAAA
jgi:type IV pilus assembly protein PilM